MTAALLLLLSAEPTADAHFRNGVRAFAMNDMRAAVAAWDEELKLAPDRAAGHWQRGIALFEAGRFEDGARQFDIHRTVNPDDVENSFYHFLCVANAPGGSVEKARSLLIPTRGDRREPMMTVHRMLAGEATPDDVITAAEKAGSGSARFYGDLYAGMFLELTGEPDRGRVLVGRAAKNPSTRGSYMQMVAQIHFERTAPAEKNTADTVPR